MRGVVWTAVLWSLCGAGVALAQEKTEAAPAAEERAAPEAQPAATEAQPTEEAKAADATTAAEPSAAAAEPSAEAAEPSAAPSAQQAEEPAQAASEAAKAADPAPASAPEPARAEATEAEKAPVAKTAHRGPFQASWQEASPDEKALFLEAFGESSKVIQERWDKATPDERKKILRAHPLLGARPMKHRWVSATPEERAAFLEASPRTVLKVKDAWENATPEQRKMLALEHPYFARKAFHHGWTQATPQEKIAFLVAHAALYGELKIRWAGSTAVQKDWYARNYPGIESLAHSRHWAETTIEERALFLEANPAIAEKAREAWQKTQPEMRATLVRKWQGWPLRAYHARLENAGKPLFSAKMRPAPTTMKGPARSAKK
jgi:hypothetical protein